MRMEVKVKTTDNALNTPVKDKQKHAYYALSSFVNGIDVHVCS